MTALDEIILRVGTVIGEVTHETEVEELRRRLSVAGPLTRRRLAATTAELVDNPQVLESEHSRVFLARIVAACIPDSLDAVRLILGAHPEQTLKSELQFSLFVALSEVPTVLTTEDRAAVLIEVGEFLRHACTDAAQAAWMAGDLLGDHWPLDESLPILLHLAGHAEHRAGREGAIHGLSHALLRSSKRGQWSIIACLKRVHRNDGDPAVRRYAQSVMGLARGL